MALAFEVPNNENINRVGFEEKDGVTYFSSDISKTDRVTYIALHPEKELIAVATKNGNLLLWDLQKHIEVDNLKIKFIMDIY